MFVCVKKKTSSTDLMTCTNKFLIMEIFNYNVKTLKLNFLLLSIKTLLLQVELHYLRRSKENDSRQLDIATRSQKTIGVNN